MEIIKTPSADVSVLSRRKMQSCRDEGAKESGSEVNRDLGYFTLTVSAVFAKWHHRMQYSVGTTEGITEGRYHEALGVW